eukprot:12989841-Ditylum_brightwellii.AAC.1
MADTSLDEQSLPFHGWNECTELPHPAHPAHPAHTPHISQEHENQTNSAAGPIVLPLPPILQQS